MADTARDSLITEIAGRKYRNIVNFTLESVVWLDAKRRLCGINDFPKLKNETGEAYAVRIADKVLDSGYAFDMLGGVLIPDNLADEDWIPQVAAETSAMLKRITNPADQKLAIARLSQFIGFLVFGLLSSEFSPIASAAQAGRPAPLQ